MLGCSLAAAAVTECCVDFDKRFPPHFPVRADLSVDRWLADARVATAYPLLRGYLLLTSLAIPRPNLFNKLRGFL